MEEKKKKQNLFKWEISINSMDSLHNLYKMLLYHLRDKDKSPKNISLTITLKEDTDLQLHQDIKDFVDTRQTISYLTILTDHEEPSLFQFPKKDSDMEEGYVDRRKKK
ncbi:hypothetical protein WDW89_06130 [Deltaproteobacteria bacterium TL4]